MSTWMVLTAAISVQSSAALATTLFGSVGPAGAAFLRLTFGAVVLLALTHRRLRISTRSQLLDLFGFSVALAAMNLCFYEALNRLPLGTVVTIEFVGPLGLALLGARRPRELAWAILAGVGILLLSDGGSFATGTGGLGLLLALCTGASWALYIHLGARVGSSFPGLSGLAAAMGIAAILVAPVGVLQSGHELLSPSVLVTGAALGMLGSAIPCSLELQALRRLRRAVFGVLMSLEPAVAALVGFVALSQGLALPEVAAIVLVSVASAGALLSAGSPTPIDG